MKPKIIATFELRAEHYRRGLEEVRKQPYGEYYSTHCALALAAKDVGIIISVGGVTAHYKRSYYYLSFYAECLMDAFDRINRNADRDGADYLLSILTPTSLPATILLIKDNEGHKMVRKEEL